MSSIITNDNKTWQEASAAGKEYRWEDDGTDGLRSYSYDESNSAWNYATISNPDRTENEEPIFSDSSTGQPFARRGNLYNMTAATLGFSLTTKSGYHETTDSICPNGWQLPIDSSISKSFVGLLRTYGITMLDDVTNYNRFVSWPLQYLPTGSYSNGYINVRMALGYWWTGAASGGTSAYLGSGSGWIEAGNDTDNGQGNAQRC